jgi:hypothetical protein
MDYLVGVDVSRDGEISVKIALKEQTVDQLLFWRCSH